MNRTEKNLAIKEAITKYTNPKTKVWLVYENYESIIAVCDTESDVCKLCDELNNISPIYSWNSVSNKI